MRTTIKDAEYFARSIETLERVIDKANTNIGRGEVAVERLPAYLRSLFGNYFELAIANYSAGREARPVMELIQKAVEVVGDNWAYPEGKNTAPFYFDDYPTLVWILSWRVLSGFDERTSLALRKIIDQARSKDWLIEYLYWKQIPSANVELTFPKPYAAIRAAVLEMDVKSRSVILQKYLSKEWYPGHKEAFWYNNHKSHHDVFFGYWSFESAAIVKMLGIDDSSFRDSPYYPKDLIQR